MTQSHEIPWEEEYHIWFVLVQTDAPKLHDWSIWKKYFEIFDPMLSRLNLSSSIRTYQTYQWIWWWLGFKSMNWNLKDNIEWTSKYKRGWRKKKTLEFFSTEVWFPSLNECDQNHSCPEILLKIEDCETSHFDLPFNGSIMIAIKDALYNEQWIKTIDKAMEISVSKHLLYGKKYWGTKEFDGAAYTDCIVHATALKIIDKKSKILTIKEPESRHWSILESKNSSL